jgi:hypothetical protein
LYVIVAANIPQGFPSTVRFDDVCVSLSENVCVEDINGTATAQAAIDAAVQNANQSLPVVTVLLAMLGLGITALMFYIGFVLNRRIK